MTYSKNNKNKSNKKKMPDNPIVLAIIVFFGALLVNYLLELDFTKNMFNWAGYYFNYSLYWLNSTIQSLFKGHPYISIPVLTNPLTPELMAVINPWMWLRGFVISSFLVGKEITVLNIVIIKAEKIFAASVLTGILQLGLYALTYSSLFSISLLILIIQKYYISILAMNFVCLVGLLAGTEYAIYLYRNEKLTVKSKDSGPSIDVKYTDKFDW